MSRPRLADVAAVYVAALDSGSAKPGVEVGAHFGASKTTVGNWVRACRDAGLLPATTQGRAGRTVPIVALDCAACGRRLGWSDTPQRAYCRQACYVAFREANQ